MKTIIVRLDPKLWKKMAKDKERMELTWEEYIKHLFGIKEEMRVYT